MTTLWMTEDDLDVHAEHRHPACDLNFMFINAEIVKILQTSDYLDLFICDIFVSTVLIASPSHLLTNNLKNQTHTTSFRQPL